MTPDHAMHGGKEMPRYQCHKRVWALQISLIKGLRVTPAEKYDCITLTQDFIDKHNPKSGGYLVFYEDGYMSYSPERAFLDGYIPIPWNVPERPEVAAWALEAVSPAWCRPWTQHKIMDVDLAVAFAQILEAYRQPNLGLATTRQLLTELTARAEVDGSIGYATVEEFSEKRNPDQAYAVRPTVGPSAAKSQHFRKGLTIIDADEEVQVGSVRYYEGLTKGRRDDDPAEGITAATILEHARDFLAGLSDYDLRVLSAVFGGQPVAG